MLELVTVEIRRYEASDRDALVDLSIRAWTAVFASMARVVGPELDGRLHGDDWRAYQAEAVRATVGNADANVLVADVRYSTQTSKFGSLASAAMIFG